MGNRVTIRNMQIEDLAAVYAMGCGLFAGKTVTGHAWEVEKIADILSQDMVFSYVALQGKKTLAFLIASEYGLAGEVCIHWIATLPQVEATNIKERLVFALQAGLRQRNLRNMRIVLDAMNEQELLFLKKIGFTEDKHFITMTGNV